MGQISYDILAFDKLGNVAFIDVKSLSSSLMHHLARAMDHPADDEEFRDICALPLMQRELSRLRGYQKTNP